MDKLKNLLRRLLFVRGIVIIIVVPIAAVLLIYSFWYEDVNPVIEYISYLLSAYALTIFCTTVIPKTARGVRHMKQNNKYVAAYRSNPELRIKISLYSSVTMNLFYAGLQLYMGLTSHSIWFYALAVYYFLLLVMRMRLLRHSVRNAAGKTRIEELHRYRFCGFMLLVMNLALSVIVFFIVWQNRGFSYHPIQTIAMAAYTFFITTMAVINAFKYKKYDSPVMSATKTLSLVAALMSMLSLETAMLSAFGETDTETFRRTMTALSGGAVCIFVLIMSVYMIVHGTKELRRCANSPTME